MMIIDFKAHLYAILVMKTLTQTENDAQWNKHVDILSSAGKKANELVEGRIYFCWANMKVGALKMSLLQQDALRRIRMLPVLQHDGWKCSELFMQSDKSHLPASEALRSC